MFYLLPIFVRRFFDELFDGALRETKRVVGFLTTIRCRPGKRQSNRGRTVSFRGLRESGSGNGEFPFNCLDSTCPRGSTSRRNQPASNSGRAWRHVREMTWDKKITIKRTAMSLHSSRWPWAEGTRNNGAFGRGLVATAQSLRIYKLRRNFNDKLP